MKGSIDCAIRLERGHIRSVTSKTGEVVRECVLDRSLLPTREPVTPPPPVFAPPISARVATVSPRRAFLPVTGFSSNRSALVTSSALRPTTWPVCRSCQQPLVHVVTLDTAELPLPAGPGLIQLFLCGHGCDTTNEAAPGVLLERLEGAVGSVDGALKPDVLAAGTIVDWLAFDEDPETALRCDKLGGWPAFEQGADWPLDDDGSRFELLFQFAEGSLLEGGRAAGWNFDAAEFVPAVRSRPVLDPNSPRHVNSLLTGDAVAFLFHSPRSGRLAFRWQTG